MKKNLISILIIIAMTALMLPMSAMAAYTPTEVDLIKAGGDDVSVTAYTKDAYGKEIIGEDAVALGILDNAIDGSYTTQCLIKGGYDGYLQIDLGAPRIITHIDYDIESDNANRWYNANYIKIQLSNDVEFRDDPASDTDVAVVYLAYDKYPAGANIAAVVESIDVPLGLPAYRYIRVSRLNNSYVPENYTGVANTFGNEMRQVSVAELDVYGYTDGAVELTGDAEVISANSPVEFNLGSMCSLESVVFESTKTGVVVEGKADINDNYVEIATLSSGTTVSIPETADDCQYVRVSASEGVNAGSIDIYGYNLFGEFARLDISDDETTVSARAKYDESYLLVLAEYDSSGRCLQVKSTTTTDEITMTLTEGNVYKAFLWNSFTDRIPLTNAVSLTK